MTKQSKLNELRFSTMYDEANMVGYLAAQHHTPTPMRVVAADIFSNPLPGAVVEQVDDGVCGFAWVNVKPGNSAFAKWLVRNNYARTDSYYRGVSIWISEYGQSMERKEKHAQAMAKVFQENGLRAYAMSRMD